MKPAQIFIWSPVALFASLASLFVFLGCTPNQENAPTTNSEPASNTIADKPTEPATGIDWQSWMNENPLKQVMRYMWIDCGQIIANGARKDPPDPWTLYYSAASLGRKAERMAWHYERLRDANRACATAAKSGDWSKAVSENSKAHRACGECHFDYWTLGAREYVNGTMHAWNETQTVFTDEPWGQQVFVAPATVRLSMVKLRAAMEASEETVRTKELDKLMEATAVLHSFADKQFNIWNGIRLRAETIARLADEKKLHLIPDQYNRMTKYCRDCHATSADGQGLDPLPWPKE